MVRVLYMYINARIRKYVPGGLIEPPTLNRVKEQFCTTPPNILLFWWDDPNVVIMGYIMPTVGG